MQLRIPMHVRNYYYYYYYYILGLKKSLVVAKSLHRLYIYVYRERESHARGVDPTQDTSLTVIPGVK